MTHQKTKYLCDFCNREYSVEKNAERHESECYYDPDIQACVTCRYYTEQICELDSMPYFEGQPMLTHHCGKHEQKGAQS